MAKADNSDDLTQATTGAEKLLAETKAKEEIADKEAAEKEAAELAAKEASDKEAAEEAARVAEAERLAKEAEDDLPQGVRSHIGRIITRQLKKQLKEELSPVLETLEEIKTRGTVSQEEELVEPVMPEDPTPEDVVRYTKENREFILKTIERKQAQKDSEAKKGKADYGKEYTKLIEDSLDPDESPEIYQMMTEVKGRDARGVAIGGEFNKAYTGDAKKDFLINYRNATTAYIAKLRNPMEKKVLKSQTTTVKVGAVNIPSTTTQAEKVVDRSKFSDLEREAAKLFSDKELSEMGL
jgi:hypothetical protein